MLRSMRKITKPIMWLVAIVFVGFMGWQGVVTTNTNPGAVATINGEDISVQVYQAFYDRKYKQAQEQYGDTVEFDDFTTQRIKEATWEEIINQIILSQEAKKRGIVVTDKEVFEYLRRFPPVEVLQMDAFMTEGQFDYNKYAQALLDTRVDWTMVENYVKEKLLITKLQMMVTGLVRVSPQEVKNKWKRENTQLDIRLVTFPSEKYMAQAQPSSAELEEFYKKNNTRFWREERANLYYIEFAKKPQAADDRKAKEKLEELKSKIEKGADFAALAKEYSNDQATKASGGDLDWIEAGSFIPALDATLRTLQPGQISPPVKSNYGWHLVKLWEKRLMAGQEQFHVSHILVVPTLTPDGLKELKERASDFTEEARSGNFEKTAQKMDLVLGETGWFWKGGYIQGFAQNPEVHKFAFAGKASDISQIIETPASFYVLQLKDHRPAGPAALEEVKVQLTQEYQKSKAMDQAFEEAKKFYQAIPQGEGLAPAAKRQKLAVIETGKFSASEGTIPKLGKYPDVIETALSLNRVGEVAPPAKTQSGVILFELATLETVPDSEFIAVRDSLTREALQVKQNEVYTLWYTQLRDRAQIKDFRDEFFKEEEIPAEG